MVQSIDSDSEPLNDYYIDYFVARFVIKKLLDCWIQGVESFELYGRGTTNDPVKIRFTDPIFSGGPTTVALNIFEELKKNLVQSGIHHDKINLYIDAFWRCFDEYNE